MTTSPPPAPPATRPQESPATPRSGPSRRVVLGGALGLLLSAGGAATWALERFVVPHVEIDDVSAYESSRAADTGSLSGASDGAGTGATAVASANSYTSDQGTLAIKAVTSGSGNTALAYFTADLRLTDATVLRSAFAQNKFGENITATTSTIAEENGAVFAINGDYYGFRDTGIVIRNGVAYRDKGAREGLAFHRDGTVEVYDETAVNAEALVAAGVWNTLSFGPSLIEGGSIRDGIAEVEVDTNFGNHSIQGLQPRTAVGVLGPNHLVFVVVDGRAPGYSTGVTMTELAQIMLDLGAVTAYNIDGGGSSTMYFNGHLVNKPLGRDQERGTSDILYLGK
ncbi:exopolysaccharide biosynthesis protein [Arthrobacter stackebrandtii]|uniref:Exopolysaccharide biosynthesis protein n=1 Tax=Arthrobacter stackebrandtii TaxID=272161 RepID=A0ABS4YVQ6_9MICC|nr:phosphodiester glycosidase family protein [Arthrobacter stackebrandtii]MBP2412851.1 exopolysaccharide biosynthesis protein [Arthrobacter stackebrandtii]PYH01331.1 exopolysaccharide biosynthesis protein [Arthrobacter stackebrandtii]